MGPQETMEFVYGTLVEVAEATSDADELLDPNGIVFGLVRFYMETFNVTGWDDDPRETLMDFFDHWVLALKEAQNDEGHVGLSD